MLGPLPTTPEGWMALLALYASPMIEKQKESGK